MTSVAVDVVQACKYYGSKNNRVNVLDHLDLTINRGTVYALLGSSGCGKTTLLNCLVGNKTLNSGTIQIFDTKSTPKNSIAPTLKVGYMPQDNALYQELTIKETMKYFGWMAGMTTERIEKNLQVLLKFLMVPDVDAQIKFLSGGEKRRVSFGVILLYDAELLILDEPTVGLDSLLRESVWEHLIGLTENGRTILLTTHYIEEAKQANKVGLMRNGYIIAEAAPKKLLSYFKQSTLEEAFLKLSVMQNASSDAGTRFTLKIDDADDLVKGDCFRSAVAKSTTWQKISALVWKQIVVLFRNIPLLLFTVMSVACSVTLFFIGVGHAPMGITVAVVNYEGGCSPSLDCDGGKLGCHYVDRLRSKFFFMREHDTENEVEELLERGGIEGYVILKHNYTSALKKRLNNLRTTQSWDLDHSTLGIHRDVTAKDIAYYIDKSVVEAYSDFMNDYLESCNESAQYMRAPINWKTPVYGDKDADMTNNGGPSYLLLVGFCVSAIVTSCSILLERNEGTFDRIMAMGVDHFEILVSHILTDLTLIVLQLLGSLTVAFGIFGVPVQGSWILLVALALINSFNGMCCGYAIASVLNSESGAMHLISGGMTPAVLLSGVFWPRECMHPVLQKAAWFLPITQSADAMTNIIHRGWNLTKPPVYLGFLNCIVWSVVFLTVSVISLRIKRK